MLDYCSVLILLFAFVCIDMVSCLKYDALPRGILPQKLRVSSEPSLPFQKMEILGAVPVPVSSVSAKFKELERDDPLLKENARRWVLLPIQYSGIFEMYKKHEASFWTAEEIDLAADAKDWQGLTENEQHFVKHILASWLNLR